MFSCTATISESATFTRTHARHITARIATDLARLTAFYPTNLTDHRIKQFQDEATEWLREGYLESVTYGFRKECTDLFGDLYDKWVLALKYVAYDGELEGGSSTPGGIKPGIDVEGAKFYSFLVPNDRFYRLSQAEQEAFEQSLPIHRGNAKAPEGNFRQDRAYGQGGRYVDRYICGN